MCGGIFCGIFASIRWQIRPRGSMGSLLRWLIGIFSASSNPDGSGSAAASSTASASHGEEIPIARTTIVSVQAANDDNGSQVEAPITVSVTAPNQEEIGRRRDVVRALFNDFWKDRDDKPGSFSDRLNEAETYLNERLAAAGEFWQLDTGTRQLLGLPTRSSSRGGVNERPL
jgi:hypothetical protein